MPSAADGPVSRWEANAGVVLHGFRARGFGWVTAPGLAGYRFGDTGDVLVIPDGGTPESIEDTWYRAVLPLVLQARGEQVLHASAIQGPSGVVVLCGESTSGKSTLAWGLATRGYPLLADDAIAFRVENGQGTALPIPYRLRLRPDAAAYFQLKNDVFTRTPPADGQQLSGLVLLERGERLELTRIEASASVLRRLLPHAYCFSLADTPPKAALAQAYVDLVGAVPCWSVTRPSGLDLLGETLDALETLVERA